MAKLNQIRGGQNAVHAMFLIDMANDTMATVVGNVIGGAAPYPYGGNPVLVPVGGVGTNVFDVIGLPVGSIVLEGDVTVETAVVGPTASTVSVGDLTNATRYLGATSLLAAGKTALVPTGYRGQGENIRITLSNTVAAATAGLVRLRVAFAIYGRQSEAIGI
jgi:hypothetical protein